MLPIQYTYLLGASLFLIPWAVIFYLRKDLRPVLLWTGIISIPISLIAEYNWWTEDWWHPVTITNTRIGIEDVLLSFTSVGVSATLYLAVLNRTIAGINRPTQKKKIILSLITAICLVLFAALFQAGVNSFLATLIVFFVAMTILLSSNLKLAVPAVMSGVMTVVLIVPIFLVMILVTPQFVEQSWMNENLLGIYPFGIPIEDILFYFEGGALSFSVFPFITGSRLVKMHTTK